MLHPPLPCSCTCKLVFAANLHTSRIESSFHGTQELQQLQTILGGLPAQLEMSVVKVPAALRAQTSAGTEPVSPVPPIAASWSAVIRPICVGTVPAIEGTFVILNVTRFTRSPSCVGNVPVIDPGPRSSSVRRVNWPISVGIGPATNKLARFSICSVDI